MSVNNIDPSYLVLLIYIMSFFLTISGIYLYKKIAISRKILSNPNHRTLHKSSTPRGGGVVFSSIFVIFSLYFWRNDPSNYVIYLTISVGGLAALLVGFIDDLVSISPIKKLIFQVILAGWGVFWLEGGPLMVIDWMPNIIVLFISMFFLVWIMNAYNFMDGVDGMASLGGILASILVALIIVITNGLTLTALLLLLLSSTMAGFLIFNWPQAKIFMGDSGSMFLGYFFGCIVLYTTMHNEVTIWTWIIVFGYYIADTTTTQIMRLIMVKKWYAPHRSHAYQNYARLTDSHLKTIMLFVLYYLIWIFPLLTWSLIDPDDALFISFLAVIPAIIFSYKFGPALSSK
jgi:Fuc2NAc and GlcNAc transferase